MQNLILHCNCRRVCACVCVCVCVCACAQVRSADVARRLRGRHRGVCAAGSLRPVQALRVLLPAVLLRQRLRPARVQAWRRARVPGAQGGRSGRRSHRAQRGAQGHCTTGNRERGRWTSSPPLLPISLRLLFSSPSRCIRVRKYCFVFFICSLGVCAVPSGGARGVPSLGALPRQPPAEELPPGLAPRRGACARPRGPPGRLRCAPEKGDVGMLPRWARHPPARAPDSTRKVKTERLTGSLLNGITAVRVQACVSSSSVLLRAMRQCRVLVRTLRGLWYLAELEAWLGAAVKAKEMEKLLRRLAGSS